MMPSAKSLLMWAILLSIPIGFGIILVLGRYAWGYLTYEGYFCGSFARIDGTIGWVLKPSATSCVGARAPFGGEVYFEAPVYTDRNGFRAGRPGGETPRGAVLAVGDSWTFGYGGSYEDSYPAQLDAMIEPPVVTLASPAYSGAQAVLLADRWVEILKPRALVYLELGFWERGACSGRTRPRYINKPCFWTPREATHADLVVPPDGMVGDFARFGIVPGGMVGAGEKTWNYFLVSRPLSKVQQMLVRAGLLAGMADDFRAVGIDGTTIRAALLRRLAEVAARVQVPLVLIDPYGLYADLMEVIPEERRDTVLRIGQTRWETAVEAPLNQLPPASARIPHDGHFGPGGHRLIAELVRDVLGDVGIR